MSSFILWKTLSQESSDTIKAVSLTKYTRFPFWDYEFMSFICILKSKGDNSMPCRTPLKMCLSKLNVSCIFTVWVLDIKYDLIKFKALPLIPILSSFVSKILW